MIVVAVLAVRRDGGGGGAATGGTGPTTSPVELSAVSAYDPEADGVEHDAEARNATDGNQATYWATEHYGSTAFGGLKSGVGLVLNAGGAGQVKTMTVITDTPGFAAVVRSGTSAETAQAVSDVAERRREDGLPPARRARSGLRPVDHATRERLGAAGSRT